MSIITTNELQIQLLIFIFIRMDVLDVRMYLGLLELWLRFLSFISLNLSLLLGSHSILSVSSFLFHSLGSNFFGLVL